MDLIGNWHYKIMTEYSRNAYPTWSLNSEKVSSFRGICSTWMISSDKLSTYWGKLNPLFCFLDSLTYYWGTLVHLFNFLGQNNFASSDQIFFFNHFFFYPDLECQNWEDNWQLLLQFFESVLVFVDTWNIFSPIWSCESAVSQSLVECKDSHMLQIFPLLFPLHFKSQVACIFTFTSKQSLKHFLLKLEPKG